jgi:hypothetical protein
MRLYKRVGGKEAGKQGGRRKTKCLNAETLRARRKTGEKRRMDPGVKLRRRISFRATNLMGSFQDDVESFRRERRCGPPEGGLYKKRDAGCGVPFTISIGNLD